MRRQRHLVLFLRAPRLGRGKSRLAAGIGALAALRFQRATLARLLRLLGRDRRWRCHLAITPDREARRRWAPGTEPRGQGSGDLGRRMVRLFRELPPGPALIIGSDIPEITAAHVAAGFGALGQSEGVFGPAADGGYWLIGLSRRRGVPHGLFAGVRWSTHHALADTLASLPPGFRVAMLETLEDVDDAASYRRFLARRLSRRAAGAP